MRKKLKRKEFLSYLVNLPACLIGMEACGGSNHWAREISKSGHEVKLMAAQFVKPCIKGNKIDFNDAEGICEAVNRPSMQFVEIKNIEQQDIQALHRIRHSVGWAWFLCPPDQDQGIWWAQTACPPYGLE